METETLKYKSQVREALRPIRRFLVRSHTNGSRFETPRFQEYYDGSIKDTTARLRLDFEVTDEAADKADPTDLLISCLANDIADLIENGDSGLPSPLMHVIDGAKKRGQEPANIEFLSATLYKEYRAKKEATEYTLYCVLAVDWTDA